MLLRDLGDENRSSSLEVIVSFTLMEGLPIFICVPKRLIFGPFFSGKSLLYKNYVKKGYKIYLEEILEK